jgi:hypothetical protein
MKMRPLIIDDHALAEVARVVTHAEAHHYRAGQPAPGDNPNFVADLSTYRCVFTFTESDQLLWRHLSISVFPSDKYPNPAAAFMIADLFGFTDWDQQTIDKAPDSWLVQVDEDDHCITLAEPIGANHGQNSIH